jgi:hypothetical protein
MARTALTVQQVTRAGLTPTYSAANVDGHSIPNGGKECLHIKTTSNACNVTFQTPGSVDGQAIADRVVALGTSTERIIGPFPPTMYNQGAEEVFVDFSAVTGVTVAAIRLV